MKVYTINPKKGRSTLKKGGTLAKMKKKSRSLGSAIKGRRKVSPGLMAKRKSVQKRKRYGTQKRYFRPKLMVDEKSGLVYASPLSGGSYLVNPRRKTMKRKRRKAASKRKTVARRKYRKNPVARRKYRRNPVGRGILKQTFNKSNIMNIAGIGVGFIGGIKLHKFINNVEMLMNYRRFTGLIPLILGSIVAVRSRKSAMKSLGTGIALSGMYDLVSQNIPQLQLSPVEGIDLEDNAYYGTAIDVDGSTIDLEGEDINVLGEDVELVGEDNGSPYAMV